jgi:hypothetical protein
VEARHRGGEVRERHPAERRGVAGEGAPVTGELEDVLTLVVGGVGGEAELLDQLVHAGLARADPLAAELDRLAVRERAVLRPAADAVPRLEHLHARAGAREPAGAGETGQAGADDHDVVGGHEDPSARSVADPVCAAPCGVAPRRRPTVGDGHREAHLEPSVSHGGPTFVLVGDRTGGGEETARVGAPRYTDQQIRDAVEDPEVRLT